MFGTTQQLFQNSKLDFKVIATKAIKRNYKPSYPPKYPDPPCGDPDPDCLHVCDNQCRTARSALLYGLPYDKYMDHIDYLKEKRCCVDRSISRNPCVHKTKPIKPMEVAKKFRSMWTPPCIPNDQPYCTDLLPRFDEIYYKPSNKRRAFQQTWVECPRIMLRPKKTCCMDQVKPPEILRRIKEKCPQTACTNDHERMRQICGVKKFEKYTRCKKICMPCCDPVRKPPRCTKSRILECPRKLKSPYPAYSETTIAKKIQRKHECKNTDVVAMCDVWAEFRHRMIYGI